jgi:hydroxyacylglutathione hydrolase
MDPLGAGLATLPACPESIDAKEQLMFFHQRAAESASLSYLFGCAGHGQALAVDVVAGDEEWFIEMARRTATRIAYVVDTHVHADHRTGGPALARRAQAPYCLHESAQGRVDFGLLPLRDGQRLEAGNVLVDVLHTPGHTEDSICLLARDLRRGDAPWFVITGDTLLVGGVGRPDLAGREREMAARLYDSLHARLLVLPPEVEVYPGHQAGSSCGTSLSGKPVSTIGFEKRWNPSLCLSRAEFIAALTRDIPPPPSDMDAILWANLHPAPATEALVAGD